MRRKMLLLFMGLTLLLVILPIPAQAQDYYISDLPFSDSRYLNSADVRSVTLDWEYHYDNYHTYGLYLNGGQNIEIVLEVPSGADFDLYIAYEDGGTWYYQYSTNSGGSDESISYNVERSDDYIIVIAAFSGSGTYNLDVYESPTTGPGSLFGGMTVYIIALVAFGVIFLCCCGLCRRRKKEQPPPVQPYPPTYPTGPPPGAPYRQPPPTYQPPPPPPAYPAAPLEKGILEPDWTPIQPVAPPALHEPRYCTSCGSEVPPGASTCPQCGSPV